MARSTFSGPILSGDMRFTPIRNVGYTDLVQGVDMNFGNTTGANTAGYPGASGQFVASNNIPNSVGVIYNPQNGAFSSTGATVLTPTADTATNVYRGAVFYLPWGANINDFIVDVGTAISMTGTTPTYTVKFGNTFNGSQYGSCTISGTGRQTVTYSAAQVTAIQSTTQDFQNPQLGQEPIWLSQVVMTLVINGASGDLSGAISGLLFGTVRYTQADYNIGNATTYPYGNFD